MRPQLIFITTPFYHGLPIASASPIFANRAPGTLPHFEEQTSTHDVPAHHSHLPMSSFNPTAATYLFTICATAASGNRVGATIPNRFIGRNNEPPVSRGKLGEFPKSG